MISRTIKAGLTIASLAALLLGGNLQAASPRINYMLYCTGCHGITGAGSPPNVPTLVNELGNMMSIPEMRLYLVRVPGSASAPVSDEELTGVVNWILEEFNADTLPKDFPMFNVDEVATARKNVIADPLKYRTDHWKPYPE